jgi:hypothetical protein
MTAGASDTYKPGGHVGLGVCSLAGRLWTESCRQGDLHAGSRAVCVSDTYLLFFTEDPRSS